MTSLGGTAHYFLTYGGQLGESQLSRSVANMIIRKSHQLRQLNYFQPCLLPILVSLQLSPPIRHRIHSNPLRFRKFTVTYIGVDHAAISFTPALVSAAIHCEESLPFFQVRQSRGISLPERRHCTQNSLTNLEYCLLLALCNDRLLKPSRVAPDVHVRLFFYLPLV